MTGTGLRGLYAITPSHLSATPQLLGAVEAALRGGAALVQLRDKHSEDNARLEHAIALRDLCHRFGALLIINDDVALAAAAGADGVHLGREDMDIASARATLGQDMIIGASCYNDFERARRARSMGADYVAFGSFFASATKPQAVRADRSLLARAKRDLAIPVAAIGGITADNAPSLIAAGADMLAVIEGLFGQNNIEQAARRFCDLF